MNRLMTVLTSLVVLGAFAGDPGVVLAQDRPDRPRSYRNDQDRARTDSAACQSLPYGRIRDSVQRQTGGRVVGQSFSKKACTYTLKVLKSNGQVLRVVVNSRNGRIVSTRGGR